MTNTAAEKTVKILVVDDDPAILDTYREALGVEPFKESETASPPNQSPNPEGTARLGQGPLRCGLHLVTHRRRASGLHAVRQAVAGDCPFAIAFIGAGMPPATDDVQLMRQLRKLDPFIEIVIMTASCGHGVSVCLPKGLPGNELLYLQKPFHPVEIRQLARNLASKWLMAHQWRRNQQRLELRISERARELEKLNEQLERDIAKRQCVEKALRISEEKFRNIVQNISDFICVHDMNGKVLESNLTFKQYVGYSPEDMTNMHLQQLIPERHRGKFEAYMERIKQNGKDEGCMIITAKDGREVLIEYKNKLVKNSEGEYEVHGLGRDITGIKALEQRLMQAHKMEALGTLAGGIAHDFNNILSVIMGYTQLSIMDMPENDKGQEQLAEVVKASNRAKELISQILTFSRQQDQERCPVLIGLIVKEAMKLLRASIPATIRFDQEIQKGVSAIHANPTQIHQVLMNLCTNAAHAMSHGGGTLSVRLENRCLSADMTPEPLQPGPYVRLTVGDTGCGMDERIVPKIFDPYFTTKRPGEGTGLGLSVVHGIVKSLDGKIEVTSQLGKGTTFEVFFPAFVKEPGDSKKNNVYEPV